MAYYPAMKIAGLFYTHGGRVEQWLSGLITGRNNLIKPPSAARFLTVIKNRSYVI